MIVPDQLIETTRSMLFPEEMQIRLATLMRALPSCRQPLKKD
jgi:hypothetical protein